LRQRSLQYLTSSQLLRHFLRIVNGLPQVAQILVALGSWLLVLLMILKVLIPAFGYRFAIRDAIRFTQRTAAIASVVR
jgi:hypothetical protein